jgi:hypothetical protein
MLAFLRVFPGGACSACAGIISVACISVVFVKKTQGGGIGDYFYTIDIVYLQLALALFNKKIIPADLLVYREKDFIYGIKKNINGIESVIDSSGKVLYVQN